MTKLYLWKVLAANDCHKLLRNSFFKEYVIHWQSIFVIQHPR